MLNIVKTLNVAKSRKLKINILCTSLLLAIILLSTFGISAVQASSVTFGYSTVGSYQDDMPKTYMSAQLETCTATGTLTAINLYCKTSSASGKVTCLLYANNNGSPGALLATSGEVTVGTSFSWVSFPISYDVVNGTSYFLARKSDSTLSTKYSAGSTNQWAYKGGITYATSPNPFSKDGASNYRASMTGVVATAAQSLTNSTNTSGTQTSNSSTASSTLTYSGSDSRVVAMWFQDISGSDLSAKAATLKAHGVTHVIWTLGTWREGESPNYEYWQGGFAQGISALHSQSIKVIALIMNTWPGAPAPVNVDNAAYNTARINMAVQIVQTYGFDGFASADELWKGTEANFIAYNNQLHASFHALGKEYWFINMCYPGLSWSISNVYGNIVTDYILPELYGGAGVENPSYWAPSFHTCLANAKSPVVAGVTVGRESGYTMQDLFNMINAELAAYPAEKSKFAGIDVFGGSTDTAPSFFMNSQDWALLDAYLATW